MDDVNQIRGCVYLQKQEMKLYLGMLTVFPALQAKGIGKKLLKAAEVYATGQQCTIITMTVITIRHELIEWYQRHGYQPTGEKKPFLSNAKFRIPKQPLELMVLEKQL